MKKYILSMLFAAFLPMTMWAQDDTEETPVFVEINETNFPDANFRTVVETFDTEVDEDGNKDGKLSEAEIAAVVTLSLNKTATTADADKISDLKGIEYFTNLKKLDCDYQNVTEINLSNLANFQYLYCRYGKLTSLIVSDMPKMTALYCNQNQLETLSVENCPKLSNLQCGTNKLTALNLGTLPKLATLHCEGNQLTTLEVKDEDYPALSTFWCQSNKLTSLTVTCKKLTTLYANNNKLTDVDITACTALKTLRLYRNLQLEEVDITKNVNLTDCEIFECALKSIDVTKCTKLDILKLGDNDLDEIDLSQNTVLRTLTVEENNLTELDLSANNNLATITAYDNQISELTVSHLANLVYLRCGDNLIKELDVTNNTKLATFTCENNQLKKLDVTKCTELNKFQCDGNQLTTLDLLQNTALQFTHNPGKGIYYKISPQSIVLDAEVAGDSREKVVLPIIASSDESEIAIDQFSNLKLGYGSLTGSIYNNVLVISDDPKADVDFYNKTVSYTYIAPCGATSATEADRSMKVSIKTYPYVMYVSPNSKDKRESFYSGTIYLDYDAVVPEGSECYIAQGISKTRKEIINNGNMVTFDQLKMVKVADAGQVIPANTPVYVKALTESGLYAFGRNKDSLETVTIPEGNIFTGTFKDITDVQPRQYLTLGRETRQGTKEIGFWPYFGTTIPAHRVYIDASLMTDEVSSSDAGAKGFAFCFDDVETTSISQIENENTIVENNGDDTWYNLQGLKMNDKPSAKGVYIYKGKKIVVK